MPPHRACSPLRRDKKCYTWDENSQGVIIKIGRQGHNTREGYHVTGPVEKGRRGELDRLDRGIVTRIPVTP